MSISRLSLYGNPNIGAFSFATDSFALIPPDMPEGATKEISETLSVPAIRTTIGGSVLLGIFVAGNSKGIILPSYAYDDEITTIESAARVPVAIYDGKKNALGNMILANDCAAVVGADMDPALKKMIREHLKVEVYEGTISSLNMLGVCAVINNNGLVCHPLATGDEMAKLGKIFNIPVDVSTINCGFPYIRVGMTANSKGVVVGHKTTGPEMARIESSLGLSR